MADGDPQGLESKSSVNTPIINGLRLGKDNLIGETNTGENTYPAKGRQNNKTLRYHYMSTKIADFLNSYMKSLLVPL